MAADRNNQKPKKRWELRDMSGYFGKNPFKHEGDRRPDIKGELKVNGVVWEIAGWDNSKGPGNPFYSFNIQEPWEIQKAREEGTIAEAQAPAATVPQEITPPVKEEGGVTDDDLPF